VLTFLRNAAGFYPEREDARESFADRAWSQGVFWVHRALYRRMADPAAFAAAVEAHAAQVPDVPLAELVPELRYRLRRAPLSDDLLAQCFGMCSVALGAAPPPRVLGAARALMLGGVVELAERDERRNALALAAAAMALHGTPVHLLAASAPRAEALAQAIEAPFATLGFRVTRVTQGGGAGERQDGCSRLVLCGTLRDIGLDYLRDRIALGGRPRAVLGTLDRLSGDAAAGRKLLLLGMQCALVEDAEEVMLDDSRAPLTVATEADQPGERLVFEQALELARALRERDDFSIGPQRTRLTAQASQRIARLTQALGGAWALRERREELIALALDALHVVRRDRDYEVVRGRVVFPPRPVEQDAEPDPADELLRKLVEVKEGCRLTGRRVVLAQVTVPRVLGRYLHLAGVCTDARRLDGEFWRLYRLKTVRASPPPGPIGWDARLFATAPGKRDALLEEIRKHAALGSVVVAARSPVEARAISDACVQAGIDAELVRGAGDAAEQQSVAHLERRGTVLVTTYPAERMVARSIEAAFPLHLIVAELHDAERHLAQIARAYAATSCAVLLSLEDVALKARLGERAVAASARVAGARGEVPVYHARRCVLRALRNAERATALARQDALSMERNLDDLLAFSGRRE